MLVKRLVPGKNDGFNRSKLEKMGKTLEKNQNSDQACRENLILARNLSRRVG